MRWLISIASRPLHANLDLAENVVLVRGPLVRRQHDRLATFIDPIADQPFQRLEPFVVREFGSRRIADETPSTTRPSRDLNVHGRVTIDVGRFPRLVRHLA